MSAVRVLPEEVKNKIAAGEVVERPASVVKELVENSIDAGSASIGIEVQKGGARLIKVIDDGLGMEKEDALLCLERHATSKLSTEEDLHSISTMGFRGEALPSIAAVSKLTITTAPGVGATGVRVEVRGGEVTDVREAPSRGTTVEVRDLFFNTPARKKFLKSHSTELMHIVEAVTRLSLSHPGTGMSLTVDGQKTMELPRASGLRERISQVYGMEFLEGLQEAAAEQHGIRLEAFFSRPGNFRDTRAHQMLFINRRPVRDPSLSHAVYASYEGMLPREKHPVFLAFLELAPSMVDFNVHPAKREVRFADRNLVYRRVRNTLAHSLRPQSTSVDRAVRDEPVHQGGYQPQVAGTQGMVSESMPLAYRAELPFVYLGETFLAMPEKEGLTILDHHAAHERVLYERLLKGIELGSRQLLFPRQVRLSHREYLAVLENRPLLREFGMEVEDFGQDTVVVRSLPQEMEEADLRGILADAAEEMLAGKRPGRNIREAVAARMACHSSIRGRKVLSSDGLGALLEDLEKTEDPGHCPHGRPTRLHYSLDALRKLFKRK